MQGVLIINFFILIYFYLNVTNINIPKIDPIIVTIVQRNLNRESNLGYILCTCTTFAPIQFVSRNRSLRSGSLFIYFDPFSHHRNHIHALTTYNKQVLSCRSISRWQECVRLFTCAKNQGLYPSFVIHQLLLHHAPHFVHSIIRMGPLIYPDVA